VKDVRPWKEQAFQGPPVEALTYADPVPEATSQKNWEKLTAGEQAVAMWLPKAIQNVQGALPKELVAAWGPIGKIVAPIFTVVGKAMMAFDLGAEGVERVWGLAAQYKQAVQDGTTGEFFKNFNSAWKAAHFQYDVRDPVYMVEAGKTLAEWRWGGDMPGTAALVQARKMFAAGASQEDVQTWLSNDLGALQFRSMANDAIMHIIFDPMWFVMGMKPLAAISKSGTELAHTGVTAMQMVERADLLEEANKVLSAAAGVVHITEDVADASKAIEELASLAEKAGYVTGKAGAALSLETVASLPEKTARILEEAGVIILDKEKGIYTVTERVNDVAKILEAAKAGEPAYQKALQAAEAAATVYSESMGMRQISPLQEKFLYFFGLAGPTDLTKTTIGLKGELFKPWTWFRLTPKAKISELMTHIADGSAILIKDAKSPEAMVKIMVAASEGAISKEMGHMILSLEGRTLQGTLKGFENIATDLLRAYRAAEPERDLLANIARVLGMDLEKTLDQLGAKKGTSAILERVLAALEDPKVAKGTAGIALTALRKEGGLTAKGLKRVVAMFFDRRVPYDDGAFRLHMLGKVNEWTAKIALAQLGPESAGIVSKATSALKAAETLAYLRINPGYPLRNFWNNEVTMFARGCWNALSTKQIEGIWAVVGVEPARLGAGIGAAGEKTAGMGEKAGIAAARAAGKEAAGRAAINVSATLDAANALIAEAASSGNGWLARLTRHINGIKLGKLDMGVWAQQMESAASRRAYTGGFLDAYWTYWREGRGYQGLREWIAKTHPEIDISKIPEEAMERLNNGIRQSMGSRELDAVFQASELRAGFQEVMNATAKSLGMSADELQVKLGPEIFAGLRAEIAGAMAKGDREAVQRAIRNVGSELQTHLDGLAVNDAATIAEKAAARIQAVGDPTAYTRLWGEIVDGHQAAWEGYLNRMSRRAQDIRDLPWDKQGAAWDQFFRDNDSFFARLRARDTAKMDGMVAAAQRGGVFVQEDAIRPFREISAATEEFARQKGMAYKAFRQASKDMTTESRALAWRNLNDALDQSYAEFINVVDVQSAKLDESLLATIRSVNPALEKPISAWRATVRDLQKGYMVDVKTHYRNIAEMGAEERAAAHDVFTQVRMDWQNRIHLAEREGLESLESGRPFGTVRGVDKMTQDIYLRHMGAANPDSLFQVAHNGSFDDLVSRYVGAGLSEDVARKMAFADLHRTAGDTAGRIEDRFVGNGRYATWAAKSYYGANAETQKASVALRELVQSKSRGVIEGYSPTAEELTSISSQIHDPGPRLAWLENVAKEANLPERKAAARAALSEHYRTMDPDFFFSTEGPVAHGWHGTLSATRPGQTAEETRRLTGELEKDLRALGYDPIPAEGIYGGVPEASFLVPGLTEQDALALAHKYEQETAMIPQGLLSTKGPRLGYVARVTGEPKFAEAGAEYSTTVTVGGRKASYSVPINMDAEGNLLFDDPWIAPLDGPNGIVALERYSPRKGLPVMDPKDVTQRTGVRTAGQRGYDGPLSQHYYIAGTLPEDSVVAASRAKYTVAVPADRIYDLGADPLKIEAKLAEARLLAAKTPGAAQVARLSPALEGDIEREIQKAGFLGYRNAAGDEPNFVKMFAALEAIDPRLVGRRASAILENFEGRTASAEAMREAFLKHFNLIPQEADALVAITERRAANWSRITGRPKEEWYTTYLKDVTTASPWEKDRIRRAFLESGLEGEAIANVELLEDGRSIIKAFSNPDVSAAIHELAHVFRHDAYAFAPDDMRILERWCGARAGKWTNEAEEKFARGFERYLYDGVAPDGRLQRIFDQFKNWMRGIYHTLKGSEIEVDVPDEVKRVFDRMLDPEPPAWRPSQMPLPGLGNIKFDTMMRDQPMIGPGLDELWWSDGSEILGRMQTQADLLMDKPAIQGIDKMDSALTDVMKEYRQYLGGAMNDTHASAISYGQMKRDSSLLNYQRRTYFDQGLANGMPFGFWTTHTMAMWAKWSLDAPVVIADYMRLKQFTAGAGANENMPSRMSGTLPLGFIPNLPFLPDFLQPNRLHLGLQRFALPFDMWMQPVERGAQAGRQILQQAEYTLNDQVDKGDITQTQADEALATHRGPIWEAAVQSASADSSGFDAVDALSTLISPHAPIMWAYNLARGKGDEIGPFLPVTRTIKGITSLMGVPGGINIEGWFREKLGLPAFDKYEDYRVDRALVDMVSSGEITVDECAIAMQTRSGDAFMKAKIMAGHEAAVGQVSSMLGLPIMTYNPGEQFSRELTAGLNKAYAQGPAAVTQFFKDHPEVNARLALFKTPQQRLRSFMLDKVWDTYHGLNDLERATIRQQLGEDFRAFLAKEIDRNAVDPNKMAVWLYTMGLNKTIPGYLGAMAPTVPETPSKLPPPQISATVQSYYDMRTNTFPDQIWQDQNDYFLLNTGADRRAFALKHPGLTAYWEWRREWMIRHPEAAPYITELSAPHLDTKTGQMVQSQPPTLTAAQLEQTQGRPLNLSMTEWRALIGPALLGLVMDTENGHALPAAAQKSLGLVMDRYGFSGSAQEFIHLIVTSPD
jgi:hypothetical protein